MLQESTFHIQLVEYHKCVRKSCEKTSAITLTGYHKCVKKSFLTERIVYFLNTVHCYNTLEEYYYEIQLRKALYDFTVETGYFGLRKASPPDT